MRQSNARDDQWDELLQRRLDRQLSEIQKSLDSVMISPPKSSQPSEKGKSKRTDNMTKKTIASTNSHKPMKDSPKIASSTSKSTKDNPKTEAVVMCSNCDVIITGKIRTKFSSDDSSGYQCSDCGDPSILCYECTLDWGSFCAGALCERFYCYKCRPDYLGEEGDDQYCGRTCMESWHPDRKKYARYRVPFSEEKMEEDKIARMCGYRQCRGITREGYRCKVKSTHDLWSASSLQCGDDFCTHHGGRHSEYDDCDY